MNERIKELYIQALEYADSKIPSEFRHKDSYFAIVGDKFAELIIGECMSYMKDGDIDFAKFMIKRNFGVGE